MLPANGGRTAGRGPSSLDLGDRVPWSGAAPGCRFRTVTNALRSSAIPSIIRALTTRLLELPLAVYGRLRSLVAGIGVLDYCETAGFTVRETEGAGGGFSVTSGAEQRFKLTELADLAGSLREAGYQVELKPGAAEPCVLVNVAPPVQEPVRLEDRSGRDHHRPDGPSIGVRSSHVPLRSSADPRDIPPRRGGRPRTRSGVGQERTRCS